MGNLLFTYAVNHGDLMVLDSLLMPSMRHDPGADRGLPVGSRGDPDAPHLTEQDRRMIKKRIANRESAQRNRMKRREKALTLHQQVYC